MKKLLIVTMCVLMSVCLLLAGCSGKVVSQEAPAEPAETEPPAETPAEDPAAETEEAVSVKTGLSIATSTTGSKEAGEENGAGAADVTLVAVTVDNNGVIDSCVIDAVKAKTEFSAEGKLVSDISAPVLSKNELGADYGMAKASSIGKEWNEQAQAFADYVEGKTLEEVKSISVTEDGKAGDADLAASVTVSIGGYLKGIEEAVNNAAHLGAKKGDALTLNTVTELSGSKEATAEEAGLAQAYCTAAVVTLDGETITSCYIDAVQAKVNFDQNGKITSELSEAVATKNQLGENYGMKKASSIGKEWNEQAAAFSEYVTGKTLAEVEGLSVTEEGKADDADLAAGVTVKIGGFKSVLAKAAK